MKLVRIVTYTFCPPQKKWKVLQFIDGVVEIQICETTKEKKPNPNTLLAIASIKLDEKPKLDKDKAIEIPDAPRKLLERGIENVANIISVSEHCKRNISSVHPYVLFKPENSAEREWLDATNGIRYGPNSIPNIYFSLQEDFIKNDFLSDRVDGIALLAEAQSCSHLIGKLHELMRFFERAFTVGSTSLIEPLSGFLEKSKIDIKREDVEKWIIDLRHPATHADRREYFALEADVRPYIHQMEHAAIDVLFNKTNWRNNSIERRDVFVPKAGIGRNNIGFAKQHSVGVTFEAQMLDQFSAYNFNIEATMTNVPEKLWFKKFKNEESLVALPKS